MGCSGCSSSRGCSTIPNGCKSNGNCGSGGCNKLDVFDWLTGVSGGVSAMFDVVEVRFKNSRKEYYRNTDKIQLLKGEVVATEALSGHDIGVVSLTGELVRSQLKKNKIEPSSRDIKKVYRKASQADVEKWIEAQALENEAKKYARKQADALGLNMKVSDVEYQGDKSKATFYYISDDRVDFRELVKILADHLRIRIEMKQIGARQEAGRLGGIGSCGRELCCSTWLTDFRTVSTSAARYQQLSINPQKLAGQCGKLKCCLNFELDSYIDGLKSFPKNNIKLLTKKDIAFNQKIDVFKRKMWFSYEKERDKFIELSVDSVNEIIAMNKKGVKPDSIDSFAILEEPKVEVKAMETGQMDMKKLEKVLSKKKPNKPKKRRNFNKPKKK